MFVRLFGGVQNTIKGREVNPLQLLLPVLCMHMPACCLFGCSFAMAVCTLLQSLGKSVHAYFLQSSA